MPVTHEARGSSPLRCAKLFDNNHCMIYNDNNNASVAKSVDASDLKSDISNGVPVRFRPLAPKNDASIAQLVSAVDS